MDQLGIVKKLWDTFGNNPRNQETVDAMKGMFGLLPLGAGDVASGLLAADDIRRKDYTSAALNGVGVLPYVPSLGMGLLGGVIKGVGNPTVYHGTNKTFDKFNVGEDGGIYFTDLLDRAAGIGKNVIPAKLKMNNPLNLKGQDSFTSDLVTKYDNDLFKAMSDGYDGVIDGDTYIVFSPDQIERLDSSALPWKDDPLALMGLLGGR